eukprot:Tbor_TRINITY_DN4695_c0_g1::TRINITY_DN4695_c0_g1_i2::g.14905::m.14905
MDGRARIPTIRSSIIHSGALPSHQVLKRRPVRKVVGAAAGPQPPVSSSTSLGETSNLTGGKRPRAEDSGDEINISSTNAPDGNTLEGVDSDTDGESSSDISSDSSEEESSDEDELAQLQAQKKSMQKAASMYGQQAPCPSKDTSNNPYHKTYSTTAGSNSAQVPNISRSTTLFDSDSIFSRKRQGTRNNNNTQEATSSALTVLRNSGDPQAVIRNHSHKAFMKQFFK